MKPNLNIVKDIRVEFINDSHWPILEEFWKSRNYPSLFKEMLPDIGVIVYVDDKPICSSYFYTDGKSIMGFLAWICIRSDATVSDKNQAFNKMTKTIEEIARESGVKCIYCQANNASLMKRLQDNNYVSTDTDMVDMIRLL